ncbi:MAG: NAD(P)-dependent oxidoreductase [Thermodesulfobacteriota bacterium]
MKSKVICLRPRHDFDRAGIEISETFDIQFFPHFDEETVSRALVDADFILASSHHPPITARLISSARSLKMIQLCGAGYDNVDLEAANKARIPVARSPGQNSRAVAEYSYNLMSLLNRGIWEGDYETKRGRYQWVREKLRKEGVYELDGMNLGILGLGAVGKEMAKIGGFFGAHLFYFDIIRLPSEEERDLRVIYVDFPELLKTSDILSLHIPLSETTRNLIGRRELALMKPSAILINTARGGIVDHGALLEALRTNQLKGAALDVFDPEPIPEGHPFLSLDAELQKRLILTPHLAGSGRQSQNRMFKEAINNILRVMRGEAPRYVVNLRQAQ